MANNKVIYGNTTIMDITDTTAEPSDVAAGEVFYDRGGVRQVGTGNYMDKVTNPTADDILVTDANGQAVDSGVAISDVAMAADLPGIMTDTVAGIAMTNPSESIDVDADGHLTVGGRLGQFPDGGLYYPTSADPTAVGNYSLVISEAKGLSAAHREFVIAGGSNINLRTAAAAGATQYVISNTQTNRFMCSCFKGGRLAVSEAEAKNKTVGVVSVKFANGNDVVPYFGATENNNNIIITVDETLNPSGTLSQVRGYGVWTNADIMSAGQGNRVEGGKHVQVGQAQHAVGNQMVLAGIRNYSSGNNSILVGSDNINLAKTFVALFGQGHDTTNGTNGVAAVGTWSYIDANTAFAVGNGTAYDARSNALEATKDGGVILKSPNGTRYKITVSDAGVITATAV